MPDPEKVAASLTKAQRNALLWCHADGSPRVHDKGAPREVSFWAMRQVIKGDPRVRISVVYRLVEDGNGERQPGQIWSDRT